MYVQAPLGFKRENLHDFRTALNHAVLADLKSNKENIINAILNVEIMSKSNLYQFQVITKICLDLLCKLPSFKLSIFMILFFGAVKEGILRVHPDLAGRVAKVQCNI